MAYDHMKDDLPADSESSKVREGKVGGSREALGADAAKAIDEVWQERITKELGFADYASMIATLRST